MPTRPRTATSITGRDLCTVSPGAVAFPAHRQEDAGTRREVPMATVADSTEQRDALVERLFMNAVGAFDLFSVYLGGRLGLYRALADNGPLSRARGGSGCARAVRTRVA